MSASVVNIVAVARLLSPTSSVRVVTAGTSGASSFSELTGTWSLTQVDGTGASNTFLRSDKSWAAVSFSVLSGTLSMAQIPTGGSSSTYLRGDGVYAAPPGAAPTEVDNATSGTRPALANLAAQVVIHKATAATVYPLPTSPTDLAYVDFQRDSVGTGSITIDGSGRSIRRGTASATSWGPSTRLNAIRATYYAADNVWRLS